MVFTDHANLQYYQHPQKINQRVARYISMLADYNLELKHLPRVKNCADPLSRQPDHNDGSDDNEQVMALLDELFTRMIEMMALDQQVRQRQNDVVIKKWKKEGWNLQKQEGVWWQDTALVITEPENIQKGLLETYHDSETAGHLGANQTYHQIVQDYWWPGLRKYVQAYVKGCGICQQNKINTHPN